MNRPWPRWIAAGMVSAGVVFGVCAPSSWGVPEFEEEFRELYYKPDSDNPRAKAFADAVDGITTETNTPDGSKKTACTLCHADGQNKKQRNDYGKALDALLNRRQDAKNKEKIQAALKKVAKMKKPKAGKTYLELMREGKLPGAAPEAEERR